MPQGRPGTEYARWKQRKTEQQKQRAEQRVKLLPPDLAQQILEAAKAERERVQERIEILDESEANLDKMINEVAAEKMAATKPVNPERTVERRNAHGELIEVTRGDDGRRVATGASIEIGRKLRRMKAHKRAVQAERRGRLRELVKIGKVERCARKGVYSAILAITRSWRNSIELGGLADKVQMGRSYYTDAAGNRLPDAALDEHGQPASMPTAKEAREGR